MSESRIEENLASLRTNIHFTVKMAIGESILTQAIAKYNSGLTLLKMSNPNKDLCVMQFSEAISLLVSLKTELILLKGDQPPEVAKRRIMTIENIIDSCKDNLKNLGIGI